MVTFIHLFVHLFNHLFIRLLVLDIPDVEKNFPNVVDCIRDWYRVYKVAEGKPENTYGFGGEAKNKEYAENIVKEMNHQWLNYYNSIEEK